MNWQGFVPFLTFNIEYLYKTARPLIQSNLKGNEVTFRTAVQQPIHWLEPDRLRT